MRTKTQRLRTIRQMLARLRERHRDTLLEARTLKSAIAFYETLQEHVEAENVYARKEE